MKRKIGAPFAGIGAPLLWNSARTCYLPTIPARASWWCMYFQGDTLPTKCSADETSEAVS